MNSINRSAEFHGETWPQSGAIPESFSSSPWTSGNRGFVQQTFLGCSIKDFNVNGGFGDNTSSLNVTLIPDEFNVSDGLGLGEGDDVYHGGIKDSFRPPPVGSPVFFKFGKNHATIDQAWRSTFDRVYNFTTMTEIGYRIYSKNKLSPLPTGHMVDIESSNMAEEGPYVVIDDSALLDPDYTPRGKDHFCFGGILQKYTQDSNTGGDPTYNVSVSDPREILSNCTLILNNYANSTFDLPNLFNIFGFLEYNPTDRLRLQIEAYYETKHLFRRIVNVDGSVEYRGGYDKARNLSHPLLTDTYAKSDWVDYLSTRTYNQNLFSRLGSNPPPLPNVMPYTGTSYARRTERGIPIYRVIQAINALMGYNGRLPEEYNNKGFGSYINFRGFNYIVDFSNLPVHKIPNTYALDFDQMTMLEFCQEICDIISHDLFL
jgi:hypothetical protein